MRTDQILSLLRYQKTLEAKEHNNRRRRAHRRGQEITTHFEFAATLKTITKQLQMVERSFKRLETLKQIEAALVNKSDSSAGRNRLNLRWGAK